MLVKSQFRSFFVNLEHLLYCWNYAKGTELKKCILILLVYRFHDQRVNIYLF